MDDKNRSSQQRSGANQYSRSAVGYTSRKKRRKAPIIIVIILAVLVAAGGAAFAYYKSLEAKIALPDDSLQDSLTQVDAGDPFWMLILGSDSRSEGNDGDRSDVMMLARIDPQGKQVSLISFPRDTRANVPGHGMQKINTAYFFGGAELAVRTVENFTGIQISHYAEIYFDGFENLVNAVGGVTVDVPEYCSYADVTLQPGVQELNGHQALIFARCRKTYALGDFTRTQCQRILVQALAEKVLSQSLTELPGTVTALCDCFATDMSVNEIINLAKSMQGMTSASIYSAMCPSYTGDLVDGVSYTYTYINQWKWMVIKADRGLDPNLSEEEQRICGYSGTETMNLDASVPIPDEKLQQLEALLNQAAAQDHQAEIAEQNTPSQ